MTTATTSTPKSQAASKTQTAAKATALKGSSLAKGGPKAGNPAQDRSVTEMVGDISVALESAIGELHSVNAETKILALNARIEAARAGTYGAAFSVVAEEMQNLSDRTSEIANEMAHRTRSETSALIEMIETAIRGTRLSDLALVNIDLIDRNLYERTCDVRWWATDGSLVDALADPTPDAIQFASKRLGVILDAYTVYHDLVLCDANGRVVANGRPDRFQSTGAEQGNAPWFSQAITSRSGDDYGFQTAHLSSLIDQKAALVYSCGVREGGESQGRILGALGILFDWRGLADPILNNIPVRPSEQKTTECYIVDDRGQILASNRGHRIGESLQLPEWERIRQTAKGFYQTRFGDRNVCVGHAKAPGFETYSTGWYSIIIQPIEA
ncbi:methyl-accepting chemotaxis protein [Planctomycetaceae bacterium SH139]